MQGTIPFNFFPQAGSWTPVDTSVDFSDNSGQYVKIGNYVFMQGTFVLPNTALVNGAELTISGMPSDMQPQTNTQSIGLAACVNNGKSMYCRTYGGAIHIYNFTGDTIPAGSMYLFNASFYVP